MVYIGKIKHTGEAINEVYYCMYSIKVRCGHQFSWEANCKQEGGIHGNLTSGCHTEAINIQQPAMKYLKYLILIGDRKLQKMQQFHYNNYVSLSFFHRSSGQTVCSEFDLNNQFPPLYFSVVKSFCNNAVAPLG